MTATILKGRSPRKSFAQRTTLVSLTIALIAASAAYAQKDSDYFFPGNLVVSRSVYDNNPNNVAVGTTLPPNCASTLAGCNSPAINDGTYPLVWNNDLSDSSFGITSKIFLDQITTGGTLINSLEVPNSASHD